MDLLAFQCFAEKRVKGNVQIFRGLPGLKIKGLIENQIEQHQWITRLPQQGAAGQRRDSGGREGEVEGVSQTSDGREAFSFNVAGFSFQSGIFKAANVSFVNPDGTARRNSNQKSASQALGSKYI